MFSLSRRLRTEGYVEIAESDPAISTDQFARHVCEWAGAVVTDVAESLVATDKGVKPPNTYGGNYGYGQLPLHTDLAHWYRPPRYVLLRCISGSPSVATHLLSRHQLDALIPKSLMKKALFSPRRRLDGRLFLLRMIEGELLRWDRLFLKPQNAAAWTVAERMQELAAEFPVTSIALSKPGQALLIDNWSVLHGRGPIPLGEEKRKLDRVYLETLENGNEVAS